MASIIKEKSMGRSTAVHINNSKSSPGKRYSALYSSLWLKLEISGFFRMLPVKILSLFALIVFSTLFLIYCRTTSLHEDNGYPEKTNQKSELSVASRPYPGYVIRPDISAILELGDLKYDPHTLRGIFWKEKEFDGQYYLTFDDGPNRNPVTNSGDTSVCESILDSLDLYNYKAVFFINGRNLGYSNEIEKNKLRILLLRIITEGHLLGNHSFNHHNLAKGIFIDGEHDREDIEKELSMTQSALNDILGFSYPLLLVRPPYAEPGRTEVLDEILSSKGQFLVSLQFDSYDYAYKEDGRWNSLTIGTRIMSLMSSQPEGGVLLMHELNSTARMLPGLLEEINKRDMSIGKLEEHLYKKYGRRS